jgi:hypothetical protein
MKSAKIILSIRNGDGERENDSGDEPKQGTL